MIFIITNREIVCYFKNIIKYMPPFSVGFWWPPSVHARCSKLHAVPQRTAIAVTRLMALFSSKGLDTRSILGVPAVEIYTAECVVRKSCS